jgi:hypothetical protein
MGGTDGRALHLLDVEYLGLGPQVTAGDLGLVLDHYRSAVDWHLGDHLVGAASTFVYERIAWDCADIRLAPPAVAPTPPTSASSTRPRTSSTSPATTGSSSPRATTSSASSPTPPTSWASRSGPPPTASTSRARWPSRSTLSSTSPSPTPWRLEHRAVRSATLLRHTDDPDRLRHARPRAGRRRRARRGGARRLHRERRSPDVPLRAVRPDRRPPRRRVGRALRRRHVVVTSALACGQPVDQLGPHDH